MSCPKCGLDNCPGPQLFEVCQISSQSKALEKAREALGWISDPPTNMDFYDLIKTAREALAEIERCMG